MRKLAVVLAGSLVASLLAFTPASAGSFDDVPEGAWFEDAVEWLASTGITTGTGEREFSPNEFVTRAQMAAFLSRFAEATGDSPPSGFGDVPEGAWFEAPVDWLVERGITTGTSPSTYSPNDLVTRAQMAAFLWRFVGRTPSDLVLPFSDVPAGTWYTDAVRWLAEAGVTAGTSPTTYSPNDPVTRAQMAVFLHRLAGEPAAGEPGVNRDAAWPVGGGGGIISDGGVTIELGSLSADGYVRVAVGEAGGLPNLAGAVSHDVEIVVTDAGFDGPVTVTVPIESVDLDAVDLVVYVLDGSGQWEALALTVTTSTVDGQVLATFTLPAGVSLAPTAAGLDAFAAGDRSRIVTRVAAQAVASPTTSSTTSTTTTTTVAPSPITFDLSAVLTSYIFGIEELSYVQASSTDGAIVEFTAEGLPPGMSLANLLFDGELVGVLVGSALWPGTFYTTIEARDASGATASTIIPIEVGDNEGEQDITRLGSLSWPYPTVSPGGEHVALPAVLDEFGNRGVVLQDLQRGFVLAVIDDATSGIPSRDGKHIVFIESQDLYHLDVDSGVVTSIAEEIDTWRVLASDDLSHVAFMAQGAGPFSQAYVWERATGTTKQVMDASLEPQGSSIIGLAADGKRLVLQTSWAPGGDLPGNNGLVSWEFATEEATFIGQADSLGYPFSDPVSADGDSVAFLREVAVPNEPPLYEFVLWQRSNGTITPILDFLPSPGLVGDFQVSDDGRYVTFRTSLPLDPDDVGAAPFGGGDLDLYTWDRDTGDFRWVSSVVDDDSYFYQGWAASDDGSTVAFGSYSNALVTTRGFLDRNGDRDLFRWTRATGMTDRVTNLPNPINGPVWITEGAEAVIFYRGGQSRLWLPS